MEDSWSSNYLRKFVNYGLNDLCKLVLKKYLIAAIQRQY